MSDIAQLSIQVDTSSVPSAKNALEGLGNTSSWLEGIVGKMVAAFALFKLAEHIKDATMLASRYEMLGVVMGVLGNNAGYTRSEMARFQMDLERTGISMIESRNSLNMMAAAQLDLARAAELGRAAQDAGRIANINSSEAFGRIVTGISTGQAIILHHMGIMVNFEEGYKRLASTIGKTKDELTKHDEALLRETMVLEEATKRQGVYASALETTGGQMLSMPRYIENLGGFKFQVQQAWVDWTRRPGNQKRLLEGKALRGISIRGISSDGHSGSRRWYRGHPGCRRSGLSPWASSRGAGHWCSR